MQPLADICMQLHLNSKEDPWQSTEDNKKSIHSIHFEFWHEEVSDEQKKSMLEN